MRFLTGTFLLISLATPLFAAAPIPRPAPGLELVDSHGKHLLASYKGKVVIVQFLLTDCMHCQACSRMLNALQKDYGPKGLQVLGAAVNEATPQMAREYSDQYAPGFPVGPLPRGPMLSFLGLTILDRINFPQITVIDRKGQIREQTTLDFRAPQPLQDEAHAREVVEKLLAERR